jgi:hypothetical protein
MQYESNLKLRLILPQIQPRSERAASPARPLTNGSLLRIINLMRNDRAGMEGSVGSRNVRLKITEIPRQAPDTPRHIQYVRHNNARWRERISFSTPAGGTKTASLRPILSTIMMDALCSTADLFQMVCMNLSAFIWMCMLTLFFYGKGKSCRLWTVICTVLSPR